MSTATKDTVSMPKTTKEDTAELERRKEEEDRREDNQQLVDFITTQEYMTSVLRHIKLVQDACQHLGMKIIKGGEKEFGRILIQNGLKHDNSKLSGIEWEYLHVVQGDDSEQDLERLRLAHLHHVKTNEHHPEFWGDVRDMPRVYVAEMVCDLFARSTEMGTDVRKWIKEVFLKKHNISSRTKVYKMMKEFLDLLLDKPFTQLKN